MPGEWLRGDAGPFVGVVVEVLGEEHGFAGRDHGEREGEDGERGDSEAGAQEGGYRFFHFGGGGVDGGLVAGWDG